MVVRSRANLHIAGCRLPGLPIFNKREFGFTPRILLRAGSSSHQYGDVGNSYRSKNSAIAFDLGRWTHGFRVIVREFHGGATLDFVDLADQAEGIKAYAAFRVASTEIICEQRTPAGAETNAATRNPLANIVEVGSATEVGDGGARLQSTCEVGVQAEDLIDVETIGRDEKLFFRIAALVLEPANVFVAGDVGVFAVDTLARPVGGPVRSILEKLRGAVRVGQHDEQR